MVAKYEKVTTKIVPADLEEYLSEHYGICAADSCNCLKTGWLGKRCPNWRPVTAKTWEELSKKVSGEK